MEYFRTDHPRPASSMTSRFPATPLLSPFSAHSTTCAAAIAHEWSHIVFPNNNNYRGASTMTPSATPSPCATPGLSRDSTPSIPCSNSTLEIEELPDSYQSDGELLHGEFEEPSSEYDCHYDDEEEDEVHLIHGLYQLSAKSTSPIRPRWGVPSAIPTGLKKKRSYADSVCASEDDDNSDGAVDSDYSASSGGGRIRRRKIASPKPSTSPKQTVSARHSQMFDMDMEF